MRSIGELLDNRAAAHPEKLLLVDAQSGEELTYLDCVVLARRWAAYFASMGIGCGGGVAVALPNGQDFVGILLGGAYAGITLCPYNPGLTDAEIVALANRFGASLLIAPRARVAALAACDAPCVVSVPEALPPPIDPAALPDLAPETPFVLIMTSGTTGGVKACRVAHGNVLSTSQSTVRAFGVTEDSRYLTPLPLFHINAQVIGLLTAVQAHGAVIVGARLPGAKLWEVAAKHRATGMSVVPAIVYDLLRSEGGPPPSLRYVVCSSAALPLASHEEFERRFGIPLLFCYGLSEAGCFVTYSPKDRPVPKGCVGVPIGAEVAILSDDGAHLPPGAAGEVVVRGEGIFQGYDGDATATAKTLVDGWLHTGDLGTLHETGYLTLLGRIKELINRGGEKIAPNGVEEALLEHPAILEAAVFPVPDDRLGEEVAAAYVLREGEDVSSDDLYDFCLDRLPEFQVPKHWFARSSLPKGGTGKILKRLLREAVS